MKIFEKWAGVQDQQAHPAEHPLVHPIDDRVVNAACVAWPHQVSTSVLSRTSFVSPCSGWSWVAVRDVDGVAEQLGQPGRDCAVHALGVALGHASPVAFAVLVEVLAPDGDADR